MYKINEILNRFLLVGDKFLPEMHLKQYSFIYSAGGPFTKNNERIGKFMQTENADNIYKNDPDKTCFQYYMAYGKYRFEKKNIIRQNFKRQSFRIATNAKYDGYQRGLVQ